MRLIKKFKDKAITQYLSFMLRLFPNSKFENEKIDFTELYASLASKVFFNKPMFVKRPFKRTLINKLHSKIKVYTLNTKLFNTYPNTLETLINVMINANLENDYFTPSDWVVNLNVIPNEQLDFELSLFKRWLVKNSTDCNLVLSEFMQIKDEIFLIFIKSPK